MSKTVHYYEKYPGISISPKSNTTRWSTWITVAEYYCVHLNEIKSAVDESRENVQCVNAVKKI